jgi:hypothetical protein
LREDRFIRALLSWALALTLMIGAAAPAQAAVSDRLFAAAFSTPDKAAALAIVNASLAEIDHALARAPRDRDMRFQQGIALGYHAKLTRSVAEAKRARDVFTQLIAEKPNDPEPLVALASWHIETVADVGGLIGGTLLGAKRAEGLALMDRALKNSGGRALIYGFSALLNARAKPKDLLRTRQLAEAAQKMAAPTVLDREIQHRAA